MAKKTIAFAVALLALLAVVAPSAHAKKGADDPCPHGDEFGPNCQ